MLIKRVAAQLNEAKLDRIEIYGENFESFDFSRCLDAGGKWPGNLLQLDSCLFQYMSVYGGDDEIINLDKTTQKKIERDKNSNDYKKSH